LIFYCLLSQAWNHVLSLVEDEAPPPKPPTASATRWAGQLAVLRWVVQTKKYLTTHDVAPPTDCAHLDDGTTYDDHKLSKEDWEVAEQMVSTFLCLKFIITSIF
jgi:hypothetical protein